MILDDYLESYERRLRQEAHVIVDAWLKHRELGLDDVTYHDFQYLMEELEMAAHKTSLTLSEVAALEARIYDIMREGDQDE